jgi:hypothetical protein
VRRPLASLNFGSGLSLAMFKLIAIEDVQHAGEGRVVCLTTYRTAPARFVKTDTMKPGYSYPERFFTESPTLNGLSVISSPKAASVGALIRFGADSEQLMRSFRSHIFDCFLIMAHFAQPLLLRPRDHERHQRRTGLARQTVDVSLSQEIRLCCLGCNARRSGHRFPDRFFILTPAPPFFSEKACRPFCSNAFRNRGHLQEGDRPIHQRVCRRWPFEVIELPAPEVENLRTLHHADVDALAVEYISVQDPSPIARELWYRLRLLGSDSDTNRSLPRCLQRGDYGKVRLAEGKAAHETAAHLAAESGRS